MDLFSREPLARYGKKEKQPKQRKLKYMATVASDDMLASLSMMTGKRFQELKYNREVARSKLERQINEEGLDIETVDA